jgi:hypothetical protein
MGNMWLTGMEEGTSRRKKTVSFVKEYGFLVSPDAMAHPRNMNI